jgi:hypothetical protein
MTIFFNGFIRPGYPEEESGSEIAVQFIEEKALRKRGVREPYMSGNELNKRHCFICKLTSV